MKNLFSVEGRVIVITGATGILGSSMVEHFAEQGAKVVILGRNREAGERLEKAAREAGGEAMFLECNVLDKAQLEQNYQDIMAAYGRIDVLINGAGGNQAAATVPPNKTIFDLDVDAVRQVVDLNLFGTILPTMVFVKAMVEQKSGSIINIASEAALRPLTRVAGYGVAKAAVKLYKFDYLEKFFATEHNAIREGEMSLTDIWFEFCAIKIARERGISQPSHELLEELIEEAWETCPPDKSIDFRM